MYRLFEITLGVVGVGALIGINSDDQSFVGKLKNKAYQEAMSLYGALDPKTLLSTPRTVKFVEDLAKNLSALIHLEQYKTKPGLKGWTGLKTQLTPKAIKQFMPSKSTSGKSTLKLPGLDFPELPDLPSLPKL